MQASQMVTHRNNSSSCAHGANIQHENFSFAQFLYLALFFTTLHATVQHVSLPTPDAHIEQSAKRCCVMQQNNTSSQCKQLNLPHTANLSTKRECAAAAVGPWMNCHLRSDSQQSPEQEEVDFQLSEDIRQLSYIS